MGRRKAHTIPVLHDYSADALEPSPPLLPALSRKSAFVSESITIANGSAPITMALFKASIGSAPRLAFIKTQKRPSDLKHCKSGLHLHICAPFSFNVTMPHNRNTSKWVHIAPLIALLLLKNHRLLYPRLSCADIAKYVSRQMSRRRMAKYLE